MVKQKGGSCTSVAPERMSVPSSNPESVVLDPSNLGTYSTGVTSTHKTAPQRPASLRAYSRSCHTVDRCGVRLDVRNIITATMIEKHTSATNYGVHTKHMARCSREEWDFIMAAFGDDLYATQSKSMRKE